MALARQTEKIDDTLRNVYRQAAPDPDHKDIFMANGDTWRVLAAGRFLVLLSQWNAVKVIDVKEKGETRVDLSVDRGATARIAVQDAHGKPLAGTWAAGLAGSGPPIAVKLREATATVYGLNPDKPRTMAFFHAEKKLGGTATLRGDEKEPIIVKLAPVGNATGRLVDANGIPREGVEVTIRSQSELGDALYRDAEPIGNPVHTDKDGRFRIEDIVPGLQFTFMLRQGRTIFIGEPRISVKPIKPGETLDLGNLRIKPIG